MKLIFTVLMIIVSLNAFAQSSPAGYGTTSNKRCSSVELENHSQLTISQFQSLVPANVSTLTYLELCMVVGIQKSCVWETYDLIQTSNGLFESWSSHLNQLQLDLITNNRSANSTNFEVCLNQ